MKSRSSLAAANGLLTARAAALSQEPFDRQLVTSENTYGCCCIEHAADEGQSLSLAHANEDRRQ